MIVYIIYHVFHTVTVCDIQLTNMRYCNMATNMGYCIDIISCSYQYLSQAAIIPYQYQQYGGTVMVKYVVYIYIYTPSGYFSVMYIYIYMNIYVCAQWGIQHFINQQNNECISYIIHNIIYIIHIKISGHVIDGSIDR